MNELHAHIARAPYDIPEGVRNSFVLVYNLTMLSIIGFSGSLRRGSINTRLLEAARELVPDGVAVEVVSIRDVPLYDGDLEQTEGVPSAVVALKERIAAADGLLIATPEYNQSIPGVAKNAVDWFSRPPADIPRVFGRLPVAVMGATPGMGGTAAAQTAWLPVLRALGTRIFSERTMLVRGAGESFDESGLRDEATRKRLTRFVQDFAAFVAQNRRSPQR